MVEEGQGQVVVEVGVDAKVDTFAPEWKKNLVSNVHLLIGTVVVSCQIMRGTIGVRRKRIESWI